MQNPPFIQVENGVHKSAKHLLDPDTICIVGASDQADVRLFDSDLAAQHLALSVSGEHIALKALETCQWTGKLLNPGDSVVMLPGDEVQLLPSDVRLTLQHSDTPIEPQKGPPWFATLICVLIVTGIWLGWAKGKQEPPQDLTHQTTQQLLKHLGSDEPLVVDQQDTHTMITGVLADSLHEKLQTLLKDQPHVVNQTVASSVLLSQVGSVFRTNGYTAQLEYAGGGGVLVKNLDPDNPNVQKVIDYVQRDVPSLSNLTFAPFEKKPKEKPLMTYPLDPNKRLTTIVDGDTAYVATTDGARYFEGSVLPNGQKIRQITDQGIQVDHHGELVWLQL